VSASYRGFDYSAVPPKLYINNVAEFDWLIGLEFGRVDDAQPPDQWRGVTEQFGYLHDSPGGRVVGFKVLGVSELDVEARGLQGAPEVRVLAGEQAHVTVRVACRMLGAGRRSSPAGRRR